jgi:hypothetical protein
MRPLGDEVRRELARFGGPAGGMAEIVESWPDAVGQAIAQNAWPARIGRDGTLHVHTADAIWAFELGHRAAEIAERAGVERIRFAPGPIPEPFVEPETRRVPALRPAQEHVEQAAELAAPIEDEELRAAVARAAAASLARAAADT